MAWSAAQALSWIMQQEPLELKDWSSEMGPRIESAQKELSSSIGARRVGAWGRKCLHGPLEQLPDGDFRISGMRLTVGPHGDLAAVPRHKLREYKGAQWHDIEFDEAEIKKAWPKPPPPRAKEWMLKDAQRIFEHTGHPGKRDDLLQRCRRETQCKKRDAEKAFSLLPVKLRRLRGKPPNSSG